MCGRYTAEGVQHHVCVGDAAVFGRIHAENLTCSISIPSSMRSRLSWNELTLLQHRGKRVSMSHHTDPCHKLSPGHSHAHYRSQFCLTWSLLALSVTWSLHQTIVGHTEGGSS